ncbi:S1 RNA-binding domain-containing protein 1-like isoform X2 [Mercenaria mercenaria]|nr:S1 RNA-binding domain-containing protein 1-like isoform X2 [Mercenaria mercenaria]
MSQLHKSPASNKKMAPKRKSNAIKTEESITESFDEEDGIAPTKKMKTELKQDDSKALKKTIKKAKTECKTEGMKLKNYESAVAWKVEEVISANLNVAVWAAKNVVKLLDEGCTIPFIARYRKEQTGGMEVQKLRDSCSMLEDLRSVETKVKTAKSVILEQGKMTKDLDNALSNAQTLTEVECLFAPFKPGNKGTLAERAKALGLEPLAMRFVKGEGVRMEAEKFVNTEEKGLKNVDEILNGVMHIIADMIHKDTAVMEKIREVCTHRAISIQSSQIKQSKAQPKPGEKPEPAHKYENYFDHKISIDRIQPHQMLAINRGEHHKILRVKVEIPPFLDKLLTEMCRRKWLNYNMNADSRQVINQSVEDAYQRLIQPQIVRLVRSNLTKTAEKASIEVFASNLKNLLLSAPLKGSTILAIDPGFSNGCKTAVISKTGQILDTEIVYLHSMKQKKQAEINKLQNLIIKHRCEVIGVGNGVACRETETAVSELIQKTFPKLKYCIVSESGASIYSVSDAAQKEMPQLDPSLRGAVSIGRRLLDPLSEFVKVDPKHLGIGQYQHDMPQNQLKTSLDSTIEECVSFVGVDVNTCSECLLSHVSGLSAARAKKVLEFRDQFGPFICREQLKAVKGLGAKTYEQAAGFIRVHSTSAELGKCASVDNKAKKEATKGKKSKKKVATEYLCEPLDMTWIHPESYHITYSLLEKVGVSRNELGQPGFIQKVRQFLSCNSITQICSELDTGEPTVKLITDALVRPLSYDLRDEFEKPLFRSGVKSINDLKAGDKVTGKVSNVTHFGAFVDIGVGQNGLVHNTKMSLPGMRQRYQLKLGEKIEGKIIDVDIKRGRIGLELLKVL